MKKKKALIAGCVLLLLLVLAALLFWGKSFLIKESEIADEQIIGKNEENQMEIMRTEYSSQFTVFRLVTEEVKQAVDQKKKRADEEVDGNFADEKEDQQFHFTYYDEAVQERVQSTIDHLKEIGQTTWKPERPLAIMNPFGTGTNGLYLYFKTKKEVNVSYTIHIENEAAEDYTAIPKNVNGETYTKEHEFQMIGLVPGNRNFVTLTMTNKRGKTETTEFVIDMPIARSKYATQLKCTQRNEEAGTQSDGLYTMIRANSFLGYTFMFDNYGTMRYEVDLENYGFDRVLFWDGCMITCVAKNKLAKINPLGKVEKVYRLTGYELHHDIAMSGDGKVLALVNNDEIYIEDAVIEIDLETGMIHEILSFREIMKDYFEGYTRPIVETDRFGWMAGKWDWLHLNSIDYSEENDTALLSSRETSAILKVENIHTEPKLTWLLGDPTFWEGTPYEDACLTKEGDFRYQLGQHGVEFVGEGEEDGSYYVRAFNNNFWSLNSRDAQLDMGEGAGEIAYESETAKSYAYLYKINEKDRTYTLVDSIELPYSGIVSNVTPAGEDGNLVINCGTALLFREYNKEKEIIAEFAYDCKKQCYRVLKYDYKDFWFQADK